MKQRPALSLRNRPAFTLMEILLVIVMLTLIVGLVAFKFTGVNASAQVRIAEMQVSQSIPTVITAYYMRERKYPPTLEAAASLFEGGRPPLDPWGNPFHYTVPGTRNPEGFDVWSSGPDGQSGTADDIGNWAR